MYIKNRNEIDPFISLRALIFFIRKIDKHIKNTEHISKEQIKYYIDRMLELIFTIEDCSMTVYNELDDEEKQLLENQEADRNKFLYANSDGRVDRRSVEDINTMIDSCNKRYQSIRNEAHERTDK